MSARIFICLAAIVACAGDSSSFAQSVLRGAPPAEQLASTPPPSQLAPTTTPANSRPRLSRNAPSNRGVVKPGDSHCLRSTGSLIRPGYGRCLPVTGRSYSGEDIRRTGSSDTAGALRKLDPSIQVHGH